MNNLDTKFNIYNENLKIQNKVPGFYTTLIFLKSENILKTNEIKIIKSCYGKIKDYRNDIVHGNIKQIILKKGKTQEALEQLYDFYMIKENDILKKC